jgi:hypothetical protein
MFMAFLLEFTTDDGLELRARDPHVEPRANQVQPGIVELRLRAQHVEQRRAAQFVAALLDAQVLGRRLDGQDLRVELLLRRAVAPSAAVRPERAASCASRSCASAF